MGNISWMFGVIGLRSVKQAFQSLLAWKRLQRQDIWKDSMAPGSWVVELGIGDSSCELLRLCRGEGENVCCSSFIKPCETNWNKMLSIPMMWVRSTCHRRCDLVRSEKTAQGQRKEEQEGISKEEEPAWRGWGRRWDPAGVWSGDTEDDQESDGRLVPLTSGRAWLQTEQHSLWWLDSRRPQGIWSWGRVKFILFYSTGLFGWGQSIQSVDPRDAGRCWPPRCTERGKSIFVGVSVTDELGTPTFHILKS